MLRRRWSLLAQHRLGILPLYLETGCFRNIKVDKRTCDSEDVDNEEHLICVCTKYS